MCLLKKPPQYIRKPWTTFFNGLYFERKKYYNLEKCTKLDRKRVTNAFNGREAGLETSCSLHQTHAKWFQVSPCEEGESGVKKEMKEIIW